MNRLPPDWERASALLTELVALQRAEQDAILKRRPQDLPPLCAQIDHAVMQLDGIEAAAAAETPPAKVRDLLATVQELALQNQLLLETHLKFLSSILDEVFPQRRQAPVYNPLGRLPASLVQAGLLLNART